MALFYSFGGGDGVDSCYLAEHVGHMRCSAVAVTSHKLFFFCHLQKYKNKME